MTAWVRGVPSLEIEARFTRVGAGCKRDATKVHVELMGDHGSAGAVSGQVMRACADATLNETTRQRKYIVVLRVAMDVVEGRVVLGIGPR